MTTEQAFPHPSLRGRDVQQEIAAAMQIEPKPVISHWPSSGEYRTSQDDSEASSTQRERNLSQFSQETATTSEGSRSYVPSVDVAAAVRAWTAAARAAANSGSPLKMRDAKLPRKKSKPIARGKR